MAGWRGWRVWAWQCQLSCGFRQPRAEVPRGLASARTARRGDETVVAPIEAARLLPICEANLHCAGVPPETEGQGGLAEFSANYVAARSMLVALNIFKRWAFTESAIVGAGTLHTKAYVRQEH